MAELSQRTVGVIGVGHLMRHLTPGLLRGAERPRILLSPRSVSTAEELARQHGLEIAAEIRALVKRCDVILLAVRPHQLADALTGLPFRADQTVVSLLAGTPIAAVARLCAPANVVRAMPVIAGAYGESPTAIFPDHDLARALLAPAGPVIPLSDEADFEAASVMACYFGWTQALIGAMTGWLLAQGIAEPTARSLVAGMTRAGATIPLMRPDVPLASLLEELCVPGSYTRQGRDVLEASNAFAPWLEACDALLQRMRKNRVGTS